MQRTYMCYFDSMLITIAWCVYLVRVSGLLKTLFPSSAPQQVLYCPFQEKRIPHQDDVSVTLITLNDFYLFTTSGSNGCFKINNPPLSSDFSFQVKLKLCAFLLF